MKSKRVTVASLKYIFRLNKFTFYAIYLSKIRFISCYPSDDEEDDAEGDDDEDHV